MTPERFRQIEDLYHAAREGTADQRVELLAQADPELRREVESLLAERPSGEFIDRPAIQNTPQLLNDLAIAGLAAGSRLGPHRIEFKLAADGMGEVYRTRDTRLDRTVAIKVIFDRLAGSPELHDRFDREARSIAELNHPHIYTLHNVGQENGVGFLVLEYLEGESLGGRLAHGTGAGPQQEIDDVLRYAIEVAGLLRNHASETSIPWPAAAAAELFRPAPYLEAGHRLGRYEIKSFMAAGGMGAVYRAYDPPLQRDVAIKICSRRFNRCFSDEARAIAALNHPNICTLHDVGMDYLVMELVEGFTLSERISQGPVPVRDALQIALQIAAGLQAAHAVGLVHRDLKPGNIKIRPDGVVKILDFGLAKQTGAAQELSQTHAEDHAIAGTAAYMSPEQAEGRTLDARTDIFSFGVLLYEMLSGRCPFKGETPISILAAILHKEPEPFDAPAVVLRIIRRCLSKAPEQRFQSATELRAELEIAASKITEQPSIAVLPFANLTGNPRTEYFSDGIADEIINGLTKIPGLKVVARTSSFAFKGKDEDIRRVAETLGVVHVLSGTVRQSDDRLRITAALIAASDGSQVWSERFDRKVTDIFAIQDEISAAISDVLKLKLVPRVQETVGQRRALKPEAYKAYLEGRYYFQQLTPASFVLSRECQELAIELEPTFALPHAGLAEYEFYRAYYLHARPHDVMPRALASAERALELDPDCSEAYSIRGAIRATYQFDWLGAGQDFDRAILLNPSFALAHLRRATWYLGPLGRMDEAFAEANRALDLDPLNPFIRASYLIGLYRRGRRAEAMQYARAIFKLFPNSWFVCLVCASVLLSEGPIEEAATVVRRGLSIDPGNAYLAGCLAGLLARQGEPMEARRIAEQLEQVSAKQYLSPAALSFAWSACADFDRCFEWLAKAIQERDPLLLVAMGRLSGFQSDDRYRALVRSLNLP